MKTLLTGAELVCGRLSLNTVGSQCSDPPFPAWQIKHFKAQLTLIEVFLISPVLSSPSDLSIFYPHLLRYTLLYMHWPIYYFLQQIKFQSAIYQTQGLTQLFSSQEA